MDNNRKQAGKGRYNGKRNTNSNRGNYSGRDSSSGRSNDMKGSDHYREKRNNNSDSDNDSGRYRSNNRNYDQGGQTSYSRERRGGGSGYSTDRREENPGYSKKKREDNSNYSRGRREESSSYTRKRRDDYSGYSKGRKEESEGYSRSSKSYKPRFEGDNYYNKEKPTRPRVERTNRFTEKPKNSRSNKEITKPSSDEIRLNRYIANSGVCSRREADELITRGEIFVNGEQVTELGVKVAKKDTVVYKGKRLVPEHKVYILMNKPKGYVTTVDDPHAEHTVIELLGDDFPERVYPVGRLDKDTTGVLLLTNDGDITKKLTHPSFERRKIYHVFLDREISKNDVYNLAEGIDVDGEKVAADAVSCPDPDDRTQLGIEIHSGQNRIIRRMMESLGYKVKKLDRVYFAGLTKKNVQRGKWRFLTDKEIIMLKRGTF